MGDKDRPAILPGPAAAWCHDRNTRSHVSPMSPLQLHFLGAKRFRHDHKTALTPNRNGWRSLTLEALCGHWPFLSKLLRQLLSPDNASGLSLRMKLQVVKQSLTLAKKDFAQQGDYANVKKCQMQLQVLNFIPVWRRMLFHT